MLFALIRTGQEREDEKPQGTASETTRQNLSEYRKSREHQNEKKMDDTALQEKQLDQEWVRILPHELIDGETL